ncbi:hypothetical protein IEO21_04672 [Rhodonia placenta]|uniref:DUF4211 domain-containing protein n=1 Tax=Rhodonia placenta TaxID=104341 RepID=A0A8H7P3H8_9APHY|nr:hypothetical protein IEO21_04672 [Postia placenta]
MPRKLSPTKSRQLKQDTLDGFLSSSPGRMSPSSPVRESRTFSRGIRRKRALSPNPRATNVSSDNSDVGDIRFEPDVVESDDKEEASPRRPRTKKRKTRLAGSGSSEEQKTTALDSDNEEVVGIPVTWKSRKEKGKGKRIITIDDSEEEEVEQPRRRKLVRGIRPPTPEEDEADLLDEVDEHRIIEPRLRTRNKKSAFQRNLEKLQKKKRGEVESGSSQSEDEADEDEPVPFSHAKPDHKDRSSSSEDDGVNAGGEDETFIVEDDNADAPELPVAFSMNTHQDLIHHFKIICQLFVHLAVHPVNNRFSVMEQLLEKEYFSVPLAITRRKITGMRDSLVTSSVWRSAFKKSLETYPEFETVELDFAIPTCDACHLGGRMSTLLGRLSGSPYDNFTYESLQDSDTEDSEGEDSETKSKKEFHLGRFCAARTRCFHKFTHWEYALFERLQREIDELKISGGTRGFVRVAFAGGVQPPDDLSDADGIMDWLDQRGIINMEWQRLKEMMASARNLEMRSKKGEDVEN